MCAVLASLQSDAPSHSFAHTRRTVEAAFGQPLEVRAGAVPIRLSHLLSLQALFVTFEKRPVASGSIAQVHRATLVPGIRSDLVSDMTGRGPSAPDVVAVKVRHPGVATIIARDFAILRVLAEGAGVLPGLSWMRLDESVRQFREPLFEQVDLTREACNLRLFNANFAAWRRVSFPRPIEPLVQPAVLVESFEEGMSISTFLQADDPQLRRSIADLGVKTLLKMMLSDNLVHADLHPGNILVRLDAAPGSLLGRLLRPRPAPHIVLLDCGMTASLSDRNKTNLLNFFTVRFASVLPCLHLLICALCPPGHHPGRRSRRGGDCARVQRATDVPGAAGVCGRPGGLV
jgi:aarF domain-containing kinase